MSQEKQNASGEISRTNEFMRLFTRHQRDIYCYVCALMPRPSDVDEVVQEANTALWEKYETFQSGTNFLAWALTVARYTVLTYRVRLKQRRGSLLFSNDFFEDFAADVAENAELMAAKLEALEDCRENLSPSDKDLLLRRYTPGATSQGVASAVGRPVVSVYKSLSRIRKRLFHCIEWRLAEKELI